MMKDFPITTQPFTPVQELEKRNKVHLDKVEKAIALSDSLSSVAQEAPVQ
jgi:hypothetical protein